MFLMASLTDPGIDHVHMNIPRVGYTRLDTDSPFCHLCMTAVHEAKWLASTKKDGLSLFTKFFTYVTTRTVHKYTHKLIRSKSM